MAETFMIQVQAVASLKDILINNNKLLYSKVG
jgi:hypothetical protein